MAQRDIDETQPLAGWDIRGDSPLATRLRRVQSVVPAPGHMRLETEADGQEPDAYGLFEGALFSAAERIVPWYAATEAVETLTHQLREGNAGKMYGIFCSLRVSRERRGQRVQLAALLPALAVSLYLAPSEVVRVQATRASLLQDGDAWFVLLRLADETLLTIEAMATLPSEAGPELLLEVTTENLVLRAEPARQAVQVHPDGGATTSSVWVEDPAERYLRAVADHWTPELPELGAGTRLRTVWRAIEASGDAGQPITLTWPPANPASEPAPAH